MAVADVTPEVWQQVSIMSSRTLRQGAPVESACPESGMQGQGESVERRTSSQWITVPSHHERSTREWTPRAPRAEAVVGFDRNVPAKPSRHVWRRMIIA